METERQLGVGLRGERDPAGAGDRQARRCHFHFAAHLVAAERERPADLPDRLARHRQIRDPELDVVARRLERAAAADRKIDRAGRAQLRVIEGGDVGHRQTAADRVERIRPIPPDKRRSGDGPGRFGERYAIEPDARPVEPQRGRAFFERLRVGGAPLDGHRAEADRALVRPRQVELAREVARHRIVVDLEGVPHAVEVAPRDPEARVDLFAAVAAWVPEREASVRANLGVADPDRAVADGDVAVLDDDAP